MFLLLILSELQNFVIRLVFLPRSHPRKEKIRSLRVEHFLRIQRVRLENLCVATEDVFGRIRDNDSFRRSKILDRWVQLWWQSDRRQRQKIDSDFAGRLLLWLSGFKPSLQVWFKPSLLSATLRDSRGIPSIYQRDSAPNNASWRLRIPRQRWHHKRHERNPAINELSANLFLRRRRRRRSLLRRHFERLMWLDFGRFPYALQYRGHFWSFSSCLYGKYEHSADSRTDAIQQTHQRSQKLLEWYKKSPQRSYSSLSPARKGLQVTFWWKSPWFVDGKQLSFSQTTGRLRSKLETKTLVLPNLGWLGYSLNVLAFRILLHAIFLDWCPSKLCQKVYNSHWWNRIRLLGSFFSFNSFSSLKKILKANPMTEHMCGDFSLKAPSGTTTSWNWMKAIPKYYSLNAQLSNLCPAKVKCSKNTPITTVQSIKPAPVEVFCPQLDIQLTLLCGSDFLPANSRDIGLKEGLLCWLNSMIDEFIDKNIN